MTGAVRSLHIADSDGAALHGGGAEIVFDATVTAARTLGHDVTVMTATPARTPWSYVYSRRNYRAARRILDEARPDIVHIQNFYHFLSPSVLAAIRDHKRIHTEVKVVYTAHDFHLICPNSGFQHFTRSGAVSYDINAPQIRWHHRFDHRSWMHSALKLAQHVYAYRVLHLDRVIDLIVSPSELIATAFRNARMTTPIRIIRNPIAITSATAAGSRSGLAFLGKLTPAKGLLEFVELLEAQGFGCRIDVYGDGPQREDLVDFANRSTHVDLAVHGHVPHSDVPGLLTRHVALVYPSTWLENAPLAVLEAASLGLSLVVPRGGGAEEVARLARVHFAYDAKDPSSVTKAVSDALTGSRRNHLLDETQFRFDTYARNLERTYSEVSEGRP